MTHSRELAAAVAVVVDAMRLQPLLTADETRRAEEAHQGSLEELMERAGAAVAELVLRAVPRPRHRRLRRRATTAATAGSARACCARPVAR